MPAWTFNGAALTTAKGTVVIDPELNRDLVAALMQGPFHRLPERYRQDYAAATRDGAWRERKLNLAHFPDSVGVEADNGGFDQYEIFGPEHDPRVQAVAEALAAAMKSDPVTMLAAAVAIARLREV